MGSGHPFQKPSQVARQFPEMVAFPRIITDYVRKICRAHPLLQHIQFCEIQTRGDTNRASALGCWGRSFEDAWIKCYYSSQQRRSDLFSTSDRLVSDTSASVLQRHLRNFDCEGIRVGDYIPRSSVGYLFVQTGW